MPHVESCASDRYIRHLLKLHCDILRTLGSVVVEHGVGEGSAHTNRVGGRFGYLPPTLPM